MKECLGKMLSVDQRAQALCKELKMKIEETELWLQLSLDT
jgi:hypothetical protein